MKIKYLLVLLFNIWLYVVGYCQNHTIINYTIDDGLPSNHVSQINSDKNGIIWLATASGLKTFDGINFQKIYHPKLNDKMNILLKDSHKNIVIKDWNSNIFIPDSNSSRFRQLQQITPKMTSLKVLKNKEGTVDRPNIDEEDFHYSTRVFGFRNIKEVNTKIIECYINNQYKEEDFENFFYLMMDTMLVAIKPDQSSTLYIGKSKRTAIKNNIPNLLDKKGLIFYGDTDTYWLYKNTIYRLVLQNNVLNAVAELKEENLDNEDKIINFGYKDNESGHFYFGSVIGGLYVLKQNKFRVNKIQNPSKYSFLKGYYSQVEVAAGQIMIGNYLILTNSGKEVYPPNKDPYFRAFNYRDKLNNLYYQDGDNIIKQSGDDTKANIYLGKLPNSIESVAELDESHLIFASIRSIYVTHNDVLIQTLHKDKLGLSYHEEIRCVSTKTNHTFLILTTQAIYSYDINKNQISKYKNLPKSEFRLRKKIIDNYYFIGTYGEGYYIEKNDSIIKMPIDTKGNLLFAHTAMLDRKGYVWISTNNGLFVTRFTEIKNYLEGKTKTIFYFRYDKKDGFLTNEFNGGCQSPAIELMDGRFSFSSMDGLVQFDPSTIRHEFPNYPIIISDVYIDNVRLHSLTEPIKLSQKDKELKLVVSCPYYENPENMVVEYAMNEKRSFWIKAPKDLNIVLRQFTYGKHQLVIRIRSGFEKNQFRYKTVNIFVKPYYYQTKWFMALAGSFVFLGFFLLNSLLNKLEIKKNEKLKKMVLQATDTIRDTNNKLYEQIKMNVLYQSMMLHDLKSPIRFIESNSKILSENWDKIEDEKKIKNINIINKTVQKVQFFIEETLLWTQIKAGDVVLESKETNVYTLLENIKNMYHEQENILKGDLIVKISCDPTLKVYTNYQLMSAIVRNFLSNSLKHCKSGEIILFGYRDRNDKVIIGCKDHGEGMPQELIKTLLDDNYRGNTLRNDSFRLGYVIIKETAKLLGLSLAISSKEGEGTTVCVKNSILVVDKSKQEL